MSDVIPPCPDCGGTLELVIKLQATNALLGGSQLKVGAREWPYLICACGFEKAASE